MYQKWLEAFHHVAMEGGFTAAARRLNLGQPTVSTHVKNLEEHFGVELFHRDGRIVTLSPAGHALYVITHDLYGHEQEAIALLTSMRKLDAGELRLSAVGPYDVMELLAALRQKRPGIRCSVRLGVIEEVLADLENFRADIGFAGRDCTSDKFHSVFHDRHDILVIANRRHPLASRKEVRMHQLQGEPMVVRTSSSTTQAAFRAAAERAGVTVQPVFEIEGREGLREAIIRGIGIGVISETEFAPHPELRALRIADADVFTHAYIVCLKSRRTRPLIKEAFSVAASIAEQRRGGHAKR